jgi:hypothetical protein
LSVLFPDLALAKFHAVRELTNLSPLIRDQRRQL